MPTITFTARTAKSLKLTPGKQVDYFDPDVEGLCLRVGAKKKTWMLLYRHRNRLRRLTLGSAKVLTLAQARDRARDELFKVGKGSDPATDKQDGRHVETIGDLAKLYIEKWAKPRKRSWRADDNLLRNKVLPAWRSRAIVDIKRDDVIALVESVAEKGAPIVANRVAALLSKLFGFALDRALIEQHPAMRIPRPGKEQSRDRVLSEDEIRAVWAEFETLDPVMAAFFKLRLLTAQRGKEVGEMRWADVNLIDGWWTIPATSAKNAKAHRVPLNASALALIRALQPTGDDAPAGARFAYVLTGARGKRQQAEAAAHFTVSNFTPHDLRRTVASLMASGGIPRLTIKKVLNHVERDITAVYDRHSYDPEKRAALTWWDAKLTAILASKSADVLPFARATA